MTGFRTLNSMTSSFRLNTMFLKPMLLKSICAAVLMPPKSFPRSPH